MNSSKLPPDIGDLIAAFQKSGMRELHVRQDDVEIYLSTDASAPGIFHQHTSVSNPAPTAANSPSMPAAAPAKATAKAPVSAAPPANQTKKSVQISDYPAGAAIVAAPYLGTFYRAPKPGAPAYVEIGSKVSAESELCLVEVMKLFTAVRAPVAGTVHAILASDGDLVDVDQPLFIVMPD